MSSLASCTGGRLPASGRGCVGCGDGGVRVRGATLSSMGLSTASSAAALPPGVAELTLYQYEICPYCCGQPTWTGHAVPCCRDQPDRKTEMKELGKQYGAENVGKVPVVMMRMEDGSSAS